MTNLLVTDNVPTRDLVLRKLRDAILSGHFEPGQRLLERELVRQMGVSRTPIREALRKLELQGLVTAVPYKGPVVTTPTVEDARALFEVRAALEGLAVALFTPGATHAVLDRLRAHIAASERAWSRHSVPGVLAANNTLHDEIAVGCDNPLLQQMLGNLRDRIVLLRVESLSYRDRPRHSIAEHRAIVRQIALGKASEARRLMEQHIMRAWRAARAQLAPRGA